MNSSHRIIENIGNNRPYYEPDGIKVDKIHEICAFKLNTDKQTWELKDELIDIVVYEDKTKNKIKKILNIMMLKFGYTQKELEVILEGSNENKS